MPETKQFAGMEGDSGGDSSLKANIVLQNRYRILGVLGGGGMGTVYQARDMMFTEAKRLVAIKEMQTLVVDQNLKKTMLKTFQREANILASLSHPAIPKIFDFFDINDRAYLVMEYINGRDLEVILAQTRELPVEKVVDWAIELCEVLDYLHGQKPDPIIFRDMKPSNVMIDALGKVRLIDFGIAKVFVQGAKTKQTMIGTEGYSAPEQYRGEAAPASDIYSLGATLHHILTRKDPRLEPPFSFHERPIPNFNQNVPPRFIEVIEKALSNNLDDRYPSATSMKEAIEQVRGRVSIQYAPMINKGAGGAANQTTPDSTGFFDEMGTGGGLQPKWTFKTEDEIRASPSAYRELALVGSYDTNVWALKLDTGEQVWKYATKGGIASSPVVDEGSKYAIFGSEDKTVYAVDVRNGRIAWTQPTKDRVRGTPRIAHDHVFVGSDDGRVYAFGVLNGRQLWAFDAGAPVRTRPAVTEEVVIVGTDSGEIMAISLSGQRKWSYRTRNPVYSSPFVSSDGIVYIGSTDNFMYAFDATSGVNSWRFRTGGPVISSPAEAKGMLYFGSADGFVYALNAQTSREKWKFEVGSPVVASPVAHRGMIYFGGTNQYFYCLDAETGKEKWKFKTGGAITASPYITADLILIGSMDNILYAFPLVG
ncbi:MAG: serine/threonine-protein kinase [bacterium]|nr:serine/threonine-protein kinase [bacterium]